MAEVCALDTLIGQAFADAAVDAVARLGGPVDLVVSHGQTVFHRVSDGRVLGTLQLGRPAWIAERLDVPALAFDTGPANALIDAAIFEATGKAYDADGHIAASGHVDDALLSLLMEDPYYERSAPKSTGKEHFHATYLRERLADFEARHGRALELTDLLATLCALTARTVADQVARYEMGGLVVSGGGTRNPVLMSMLAERLPGIRLSRSEELGVPGDAKEAIAFAVLGWFTAHGWAASLPSCTGAARASAAPERLRFAAGVS